MKKPYPSREKDRWEHALSRPLRGLKFEVIELMRMDLFEYLDVITTCPYDQKKYDKNRARDLRRIAVRLAEMTPRRAKALRAALDSGRIEYSWACNDAEIPMPIASDEQRYWESVVLNERSGG
ncbi:MAG: hypothetical protein WB679_06380 [Terracidiphilus sp.]